MPQVTQPQVTLTDQIRAHGRVAIAALLALAATAAVVLVLALGGESADSVGTAPAATQVSGPDESHVAAAVAARSTGSRSSGPDESRTAAAVSQPIGGPR
jgi:hypothetical protein